MNQAEINALPPKQKAEFYEAAQRTVNHAANRQRTNAQNQIELGVEDELTRD